MSFLHTSGSSFGDGSPSQLNSDATKHRRSRNGCFTCRSRRVKCDEAKPVCGRCKKASRDCLFPSEPPRSGKPSPSMRSGEEVLSTIEDPDSPEATKERTPSSFAGDREYLSTPTLSQSGTPPYNSNSVPYSFLSRKEDYLPDRRESSSLTPTETEPLPHPLRESGIPIPAPRKHKSDLSPSDRYYLDFQRKHMSHYHYGLNTDSRGFVHNFLIESALTSDALLQAVLAFAAYHHAIRSPDGKVQDFLKPYSQAMSLLRNGLANGKPPDVTDLLTMLQLSALEECLGDWVNLQNHAKAAFAILTSLYDAQTLTQNDTGNRLLEWYIRFDLLTAFISGSLPNLSRDWLEATHRFFINQIKEYPHDLGYKYDERGAMHRLLAQDVSGLFRKAGKVSAPDFQREANLISRNIAAWYRDLSPAILDPNKVISDFPEDLPAVLRTDDDADSITVYGEELWPTNHMLVHFWGLELMFNHHLATIQGEPTPPDVTNIALKICQMFEAVQRRDPTPGAMLGVQAASGMAVPFLRKDHEVTMWGRAKQALIERSGYVYPAAYRQKMSEAWGVDVTHWWLPNDDGFLPILQQIRAFIEYRTTPPKDRSGERLREMAGIFETLKLDKLEQTPSPMIRYEEL